LFHCPESQFVSPDINALNGIWPTALPSTGFTGDIVSPETPYDDMACRGDMPLDDAGCQNMLIALSILVAEMGSSTLLASTNAGKALDVLLSAMTTGPGLIVAMGNGVDVGAGVGSGVISGVQPAIGTRLAETCNTIDSTATDSMPKRIVLLIVTLLRRVYSASLD
jgi:hypothetical protein